MKATELISKLQEYISQYGDMNITISEYSGECGSYQADIEEIEIVRDGNIDVFTIY